MHACSTDASVTALAYRYLSSRPKRQVFKIVRLVTLKNKKSFTLAKNEIIFAFFRKSFSFKMASYLNLSPGLFFLVWSDGKNDDVVIVRIVVKRTQKTKAGCGGETGSNSRNSQLPFAMPPNPTLFSSSRSGDIMIVERTRYISPVNKYPSENMYPSFFFFLLKLCCSRLQCPENTYPQIDVPLHPGSMTGSMCILAETCTTVHCLRKALNQIDFFLAGFFTPLFHTPHPPPPPPHESKYGP